MGLTILLITFIVLATLLVIFLGKQAKRIADCYEDSIKYSDADLNKPTFIRINDDEGLDYIFNTNDISIIVAIDCLNRKENKYLLRFCLKDYSKVTDELTITFAYHDKSIRDKIYNDLADYNICKYE